MNKQKLLKRHRIDKHMQLIGWSPDRPQRKSEWSQKLKDKMERYPNMKPWSAKPWFGVEFGNEFFCLDHAFSVQVMESVMTGKAGQMSKEDMLIWPDGNKFVWHVHGKQEKCKVCKHSLLEVRKQFQKERT